MWSQLKRISIPKFKGDVRTYESWWTAFSACVDQSAASPEYKLLHLRQSLEGEPLRWIEMLGHSPRAYQKAKEVLERKYGGVRRKISVQMEELEKVKLVRQGNVGDLENLAYVVENVVFNLINQGRVSELDKGTLYLSVLKKLPESKIIDYQRWNDENNKIESLVMLKNWLMEEAEFSVAASETIHGFQ